MPAGLHTSILFDIPELHNGLPGHYRNETLRSNASNKVSKSRLPI